MGTQIIYAFVLTLAAGAATGIGSAVALLSRRTNVVFLSLALGLSAGDMLYLSFMELLYEARGKLSALLDSDMSGTTWTAVSFFAGVMLAFVIARLVPSADNPHEAHPVEEMRGEDMHRHRLRRMGIATAIVLGVHNFSEGIATFAAGIYDTGVGVAVAAAIAIHNIPEGIAVSVPIYYATKSRRKAFWWSFLSGMAEPLGAIVAYLILMPFITPILLQCAFAAVAGIMVFVSLDELLPAAHQYGRSRLVVVGLIAGMAAMAISLIIMKL